jgi:hypothetical protein
MLADKGRYLYSLVGMIPCLTHVSLRGKVKDDRFVVSFGPLNSTIDGVFITEVNTMDCNLTPKLWNVVWSPLGVTQTK